MNNVIIAKFSKGVHSTTAKVFQYDAGDRLQFTGLDLPSTYKVDFSNSVSGVSKPVLGGADGVEIPAEFFIPGSTIYAWIVLPQDNGRYTKYQVNIPISQRAKPTDETPSPSQKDVIDQAIELLNEAYENVEEKIDTALQEAKDSGEFDGEDGINGSTIWTYTGLPISPWYTFYRSQMRGTPNAVPKTNDLILNGTILYRITVVSDFTVLAEKWAELKGDPGKDGEDGFNPSLQVRGDSSGYELVLVNKDSTDIYNISNVSVFNFHFKASDQTESGYEYDPTKSGVVNKFQLYKRVVENGNPVIAFVTFWNDYSDPFTRVVFLNSYLFEGDPFSEDDRTNPDTYSYIFNGEFNFNSGTLQEIIIEYPANADWPSLSIYDRAEDITYTLDYLDQEKLAKSGDEMSGVLAMGGNKITGLASGESDSDAATLGQVADMVKDGSGIFRGSFATKAAFLLVNWQSTTPDLPNYVDNMDFCVILNDESKSHECWRYVYTTSGGWAAQYRINESPMTQAQINALNSGITANKLLDLESFKQSAGIKLNTIGDLSDLDTTDKSSIVGAINELAADSGENVFIAEYGVTTEAELEEAYQAGMAIFCDYVPPDTTGIVLRLSLHSAYDIGASVHVFYFTGSSAIGSDYITEYTAICGAHELNAWSMEEVHSPTPRPRGNPEPLGTAAPGTSTFYSRHDHVHQMPSASDVGAVASSQGVAHAGEFVVVGSDGNITTVTMSVWQGGYY